MTGVVTLVIEPNPHGHRFSYVRQLVELTADDKLLLLTSRGATASTEFAVHLSDIPVPVYEVFDSSHPSVRELVEIIGAWSATRQAERILVMDADGPLKGWTWAAHRVLRRLEPRPRVTFLLTRYPLQPRELSAWVRRVGMAALVAIGRATRTIHVAVALGARGASRRGLLVRQIADPSHSRAHARDRATHRATHGLDQEAILIGVFGILTPDKNLQLLIEATDRLEATLLMAGTMEAGAEDWWVNLAPGLKKRAIHRGGYLDDHVLDELMACCDVIAVTMNYDRPSAIMGKALASGVPVISAGSRVRARELAITGAGVSVPLTVNDFVTAVRTLDAPIDGWDRAAVLASPKALVDGLMER